MTALYLSRVVINPANQRARREISNPYELHRTLSKAFAPAGSDSSVGRKSLDAASLLFRVEVSHRPPSIIILVQSRTRPDWEKLGVPADFLLRDVETKEFSVVMKPDQRCAFRLRANPTVKRGGKRWGLHKDDERIDWLARKLDAAGCQLVHLVSVKEASGSSSIRGDTAVIHSAVQYDGVLLVRQPDALAEAVASGIGPGKAFGLGLLSLRA